MAGVGIISILDGMAEGRDDADNLASLLHSVQNVAGVIDQMLAVSHLSLRLHTHYFAILHDDAIHRFVQHMCLSKDGNLKSPEAAHQGHRVVINKDSFHMEPGTLCTT